MKKVLLLSFLSVASGCSVIRPTDPYHAADVPYHSVQVRTVENTASIIPEGTMALQQAIDAALSNNPEIAATEMGVSAAQARRDQAFSERLPRLSLTGSYAGNLDEQRILPVRQPGEPAILSRDILSGDIVLSLPLFTGGRLVNQVKAADLLHEAALHQLARSREELVFNVSSIFYSILAQRHVIESLEFSKEALEEHLQRIDELIEAEKAAGVDRLRTEVRMADVRQKLVNEKNIMTIQCRVLANLLGLEKSFDTISLLGELESQEEVSIPQLDKALSIAWESRDDYLAAKSSLEAQARKVDTARAGYWPSMYIQGSYGQRWAAGPKIIGSGVKSGDVGRIGLAMDLPLFDGGRINAIIREERADLSAAQERFGKLELQIRLEVESALSNVRSAEERLEATKTSIVQARESLRIEQQKYELGSGTIVDVLDAQAALMETETTYYRIQSEYHTAAAQLQLAIGEQ